MFMEIVSDFPIIFNKLPLVMLSYNILKSKIICKGYLLFFQLHESDEVWGQIFFMYFNPIYVSQQIGALWKSDIF